MMRFALLVGLIVPMWGASVSDILAQVDASIPADELSEPGNPARATAIAALAATDLGLDPSAMLDLRLSLAEAWLDALDHAKATEVAGTVASDATTTLEQRERSGFILVGAWLIAARSGVTVGNPEDALKVLGNLPPRVAARAAVARAERLMIAKDVAAIAQADIALLLLKDQPAEERVPVYALRLLSMEASGAKPTEVLAWLQARSADPAAAQLSDLVMTAGQKLVGQPAPRLIAPRIDGQPGNLDLATLKGKPVLLDFFATWCKPCVDQAPEISALVKRLGDRIHVVGISLDSKDTLDRMPTFLKEHGITWPVVGDGQGWDGETHAAFHVKSIPHFILIGPDGRIASVDLSGENGAATAANIERALSDLNGEAPPAATPGAAPITTEDPLP